MQLVESFAKTVGVLEPMYSSQKVVIGQRIDNETV